MVSSSKESTSTLEDNNSPYNSNLLYNDPQDKLVVGPNGNKILCDSPVSSELPLYAGPDDNISSSASPTNEINETKEPKITTATATTATKSESNKLASTERARPRRVIGNYTLINTLGSGSMGKVRLAVHGITGDKLAVKIVPRKLLKKGDEQREIRTIREASITLLLYHPFIVGLKEMVILDSYYYLFMEYVNGGQLLDYIISHGKLKEKQARRFARQIASSLDYCHRNSIVHRDLKIENILISQSGNIKIIDFGLSNLYSPRSLLSTFCGSLYFAAPELLNAKAYTGPEVDVWSFGVVMYVLVCGKVPFDDQNIPALHEKIKRGVVDYPTHLTTDCKSILSRMLVTNPTHRATVSEIIIHPWLNKGYDAPINNYLPSREPLTLPVDLEVIKGMTGFDFGSEPEIKEKLEKIILSKEYQKASKLLAERSTETLRNHKQGPSVPRFASHSKKTFLLANDDPQSIPAAYHPLVSIYYLVRERMERESNDTNRMNSPKPVDSPLTKTMSHSSTQGSARIPDIVLPDSIHPATSVPFEQSLFGEPDMFGPSATQGVAYGKKGKTNIKVDEEGHVLDVNNDKNHFIENGLNRLFSRSRSPTSSRHHHGRRRSSPSSHSSLEYDEDTDLRLSPKNTRDSSNVLRRLSSAMSRMSTDKNSEPLSGDMGSHDHNSNNNNHHNNFIPRSTSTSTPIKIPSREYPTPPKPLSQSYAPGRFPNSMFDSLKSPRHEQQENGLDSDVVDATTAAAIAAAASSANHHSNTNTFSNKLSKILPRRMTLNHNTMNAENHNHFLDMVHRPSQMPTTNQDSNSKTSDLGLQQQEQQQYFTSPSPSQKQQHSHEQSFPTIADGSFSQKGTADENIKPVFLKGLFSVTTTSTKHPSVIRADLIRVLERIGVKWRESKGRFECAHVPSIDLNKVVVNEEDEDEEGEKQAKVQYRKQSFSSAEEGGEHASSSSGRGTAVAVGNHNVTTVPVVAVPDLVVRFEIYIVKMPWLLGMHGLQFRRVGGDPWLYKNMCSKILAELKL